MGEPLTVQKIDNTNLDNMVKLNLKQSVEKINSKLDAIQYQRENVKESKRDDSQPAEGQYPGYDNEVRLEHVLIINGLKKAVSKSSVANDDDLWRKKREIVDELNTLETAMKGTKRRNNLDGKEKLLKKALSKANEIIELEKEANS